MIHEHRKSRYHISDAQWERLEPLLCPARKERRGRPGKAARLMFDGIILWILRTGAPWRDLPAEFGPWQTVYKRFNMWAKSSVWASILSNFAEDADFEVVMVDGSYIRAHQHSAGAKGGAKPKRLGEAEEA